MKLHATSTQQYQTVTAYDHAGVEINAMRFDNSLLVLPEIAPAPWPVASFDQLSEENFEQIAATAPDVVILGASNKQRFVHPNFISHLTERLIRVKAKKIQAACRTFYILMAVGRKGALAL